MWNVARKLHRWLGIALALPVVAQAVTGCIIAFNEPAVPGITQAPGARQKVSAIIAAAHAAAPDLLPSHYRTGPLPQSLASVDLAATGQRDPELRLTVDPVTLAVVSVEPATQPYWRLAHDLHENLLIPLSGGRSIIGWIGVGLLVLAITGVPLWWQRPRPDLARRGKVSNIWFLRELHAGFGIWLVAMLTVQAVSGISLAFPRTVRSLLGIEARPAINAGADGGTLDIDAVVERATTTVPGAQLTDLLLPRAPGRPAVAVMRIDAGWDVAPPAIAAISPSGRRVLSLQDPRQQSAVALLGWLRALHTGAACGLLWRAAVILLGLLLPLLPITGLLMWLRRHRRGRIGRTGPNRTPLPLNAK
jgi:uncharacterized iron-regulated membrane protein